jgi:hypothetical protein
METIRLIFAGGGALEIGRAHARQLYEELWNLSVGTRGAVTAASKLRRSLDRPARSEASFDDEETKAVRTALEHVRESS